MSRIARHPEAFALSATRQRHPRAEDGAHLDAIRSCPCAICGTTVGVEAAHLRSGDARYAKPSAGAGTRPDDRWSTPMCARHHRDGPDAQHTMNELEFWRRHGIDPFWLAAALWSASPSVERMTRIVNSARMSAAERNAS
jgi:hypothetical protein